MNFKDKYTTEDKIKADTKGKEKDKSVITNDAFALGELLEQLNSNMDKMRLKR
jgi:hypothetical protein